MTAELEPTEKNAPVPARTAAPPTRSTWGAVRSIRSAVILGVVGMLVAAIALPAFANGAPVTAASAKTAQQLAAGNAQSIVVASGVASTGTGARDSFTATTPQEIQKKKDDDAAAAAAAKAASEASSQAMTASVHATMATIAKPGQVIYPMVAGSYTLTDGFGAARSGRSHMGQDFAAPVGTPIYAITDGCVEISQSSYGGYGETVQLSHPGLSGGSAISTLYGHMSYRAVGVGQCVSAGQYLGEVGATGWVSGSCLHFEVLVNGTEIDPLAWLQANVI
ncbi:M23 family metallopeptidase [uncultured Microbacterium sp.]|uniref:M23 family metallopeptidase n=1 Tax=uncultured Microbacterium sp. TaxID=191216 RepID=UPI0025CEF026|nr:M23 family metallopeptidase [uncultured Microbacterium sp.]